MSKEELEKNIKRYIIDLHKKIFGKGPKKVALTIGDQIIMFCCFQTLNDMEKFQLGMPKGPKIVSINRKIIWKNICPKVVADFKCHGFRVISTTIDLVISEDAVYGSILVEKNQK